MWTTWNWHVYDSEGEWVGQFVDEATAKSWVNKREGFTINQTPPSRPKEAKE
jgi:hypothetical protein